MSLIGHTENAWTAARLRKRLVADFRNFHFSGRGALYWGGLLIAALLFACAVTLYFLDWNEMRGPIARYASGRLGREVRIDGPLKVDLFRWQPRVEVGGLYIGNPAWLASSAPGRSTRTKDARAEGASVRRGVVEFRLLPAILGDWQLALLQLDSPRVLVVRDAKGRTNWDGDRTHAAAAWHLPPIRRFVIRDGHVEIDDQLRKLKFLGTVSSQERLDGGRAGFQLTGDGTLNGKKFLAAVRGGPLLHVDAAKPYAFRADVRAGDTQAVLDGSILHPFQLDRLDADFHFSGASLADLYYLTGLALPGTPPYRIHGHLSRSGALYSLQNMTGMVGESDLHGDMTVDAAGVRPMLRGNLNSRMMDLNDLGALFRGGKESPARSLTLLPDVPLHTERLRQMDADVAYAADTIRSRDFPLRGLVARINIADSVMTLRPLAFTFSQGKLSGWLKIDARGDVPVTSMDARITGIKMENFITGDDTPLRGTAEARAVLGGVGNSVHMVAASATGTVTAVIPSGQMRHSLAEWLGVNVVSALGLTLAGDDGTTALRCAVIHFTAQKGLLRSGQFVFDTEPVLIQGAGSVDLGRETMDLRLQGAPKHFQFVRLRAPITIRGPLDRPAIGIDAASVAVQGLIGAGLMVLNPLAGILAFVDPGLAKDANCAGLLGTARDQGAPVTRSQIRQPRLRQPSSHKAKS